MRPFVGVILLIGLGSVGGAACSTTRAATPVERPALEVPPPPPRVIVPLPPPQAPLPDPVDDLPPNPNAGTSPRPRPNREKPEPAKPETKPPETPPVEPPPQQAGPPAQVPQLRMPESTNDDQAAKQIQDTINRARAILVRIDVNNLTEPRKKAHADAQLFAQQADDALKAKNLLFAKELAEKAERLAKELQGR